MVRLIKLTCIPLQPAGTAGTQPSAALSTTAATASCAFHPGAVADGAKADALQGQHLDSS